MNPQYPFVNYLQSKAEDRAVLAALRRGLGQPPGTVPDMFPYVVRFLADDVNRWTEQCYYLIAALYALHPQSAPAGNLGAHFARTLDPNADRNDAIERRFTALLTAHPDDLHFYLRQAISFLKSKDVSINWHQLLHDLLKWENPKRRPVVQKQWAAQFWRSGKPIAETGDNREPETKNQD